MNNKYYLKEVELGEKALKNGNYVSAIKHFGKAQSVVGLIKVMNAKKPRKDDAVCTAVSFDVMYNKLTGEEFSPMEVM